MTSVKDITIDSYDYPLPDSRIARHPLPERDACKLLVRQRDGSLTDSVFSRLGDFLPAGSALIFNDTRVINARLRFRKGSDNSGAAIEIFCLEPESPRDYAVSFASEGPVSWICFVGNSKRWKDEPLTLPLSVAGDSVTLTARRGSRLGNASVVEFSWNRPGVTFADIISAAGEIPIPPYLNRATEECDSRDYQTVYSETDGSVAAPTAGLHFTRPLLDSIEASGHRLMKVTLHVGAGTFQPVKSDSIGEHPMHSEFISVDRSVIAALAKEATPVTAVGTTSVRTLESLYHIGCLIASRQWTGEVPQWYPYEPTHPQLSVRQSLEAIIGWLDSEGSDTLVGSTRIIIAPGYRFRIVDAIVTNFHQPRSTLLLLVSAFIGESWRGLYDHALADEGYRFLSYGDACLLLRPESQDSNPSGCHDGNASGHSGDRGSKE